MSAWSTRGAVSSSRIALVSFLVASLSAGVVLAGSSRTPKEPARLAVTAVSGPVAVTMAGVPTPVQPESTVTLPARIVTGDDGMLGLTQAGTNITIAADSDIEIPAEAADGRLIARLVQHRGQVFYDVAHRDVGTLRVETPFLVAVIKGTQFNVTVQESSTAISLFQGRLEIRTPDASEVIQLNAGEIAIRGNADKAIRVLGMNEKRVQAPRGGDGVVARADVANVDLGRIGAKIVSSTVGSVQPTTTAAPAVAVDLAPTSGAVAAVDLGVGTTSGAGTAVNLGSTTTGGVSASIDLSSGATGAGAVVTLGDAASVGAHGTGSTGVDIAGAITAGGSTAPSVTVALPAAPVVAPAPTPPVVLPSPAPVINRLLSKP
jgi:hypothetical protein